MPGTSPRPAALASTANRSSASCSTGRSEAAASPRPWTASGRKVSATRAWASAGRSSWNSSAIRASVGAGSPVQSGNRTSWRGSPSEPSTDPSVWLTQDSIAASAPKPLRRASEWATSRGSRRAIRTAARTPRASSQARHRGRVRESLGSFTMMRAASAKLCSTAASMRDSIASSGAGRSTGPIRSQDDPRSARIASFRATMACGSKWPRGLSSAGPPASRGRVNPRAPQLSPRNEVPLRCMPAISRAVEGWDKAGILMASVAT